MKTNIKIGGTCDVSSTTFILKEGACSLNSKSIAIIKKRGQIVFSKTSAHKVYIENLSAIIPRHIRKPDLLVIHWHYGLPIEATKNDPEEASEDFLH